MIAAVDLKNQVVWGVGSSGASALREAHEINATKKPDVRFKGKLDLVPIKPFPDHLDGIALFDYCITSSDNSQLSLLM